MTSDQVSQVKEAVRNASHHFNDFLQHWDEGSMEDTRLKCHVKIRQNIHQFSKEALHKAVITGSLSAWASAKLLGALEAELERERHRAQYLFDKSDEPAKSTYNLEYDFAKKSCELVERLRSSLTTLFDPRMDTGRTVQDLLGNLPSRASFSSVRTFDLEKSEKQSLICADMSQKTFREFQEQKELLRLRLMEMAEFSTLKSLTEAQRSREGLEPLIAMSDHMEALLSIHSRLDTGICLYSERLPLDGTLIYGIGFGETLFKEAETMLKSLNSKYISAIEQAAISRLEADKGIKSILQANSIAIAKCLGTMEALQPSLETYKDAKIDRRISHKKWKDNFAKVMNVESVEVLSVPYVD